MGSTKMLGLTQRDLTIPRLGTSRIQSPLSLSNTKGDRRGDFVLIETAVRTSKCIEVEGDLWTSILLSTGQPRWPATLPIMILIRESYEGKRERHLHVAVGIQDG